MSEISRLLRSIRPHAAEPIDCPESPFRLEHRVETGAHESEISATWPTEIPVELADFWRAAREAWVFRDIDYGQWGLHLLSPRSSALRTEQEKHLRPQDYRVDDVVIGEFLGDSDLVVMTGRDGILIALPIDARSDWPRVASGLGEFVARTLQSCSEKYWEARIDQEPG